MSKLKQLLDVIANVRALADSLEELSGVLDTAANPPWKGEEEYLRASGSLVDGNAPQKLEPETVTEPETPKVTLEEVRAVLAEKSRKGLNAEVRELLLSHGCKKLSEVEETFYGELLKEAEALGNG